MDYIKLSNVTYTYPLSKEPALRNITYSFQKGKFYGIIGENGGGKTTLCNLLKGLIPHFYRGTLEGEMLIKGQSIMEVDLDILPTQIGYIFQNPFTQISGVKNTVFEEIALGLENLGVPKQEIIERVIEVIKLLKIEGIMKSDPNNLSGGQRQRVAFASIIVMEPELLIIDEPTSQLDPQGTKDIFTIIQMLKEKGKTVILVEHKVDLMAEYVEEIIVMSNGSIIHSGTTNEVLSNISLLEEGIRLPQAAIFSHEMQRNGLELDEFAVTKKQCVDQLRKRIGDS